MMHIPVVGEGEGLPAHAQDQGHMKDIEIDQGQDRMIDGGHMIRKERGATVLDRVNTTSR